MGKKQEDSQAREAAAYAAMVESAKRMQAGEANKADTPK